MKLKAQGKGDKCVQMGKIGDRGDEGDEVDNRKEQDTLERIPEDFSSAGHQGGLPER